MRSWTARVTAAATTTTTSAMGKVRLIRMECGQGRNDNTGRRACQKLAGRVRTRLGVLPFNQLSIPGPASPAKPTWIGVKCRPNGGSPMKHFTFFLVAVATMAGLVTLIAAARGHADAAAGAPYITEIPQGYRDWKWISSAHEAGKLNSLGAVLGNDVAFKAFREGKLPYPDGTMHCCFALSLRAVGGKQQSLWPSAIFRSRSAHEYSVYGQGLKKVRRNRRLGIRSLRGRQTWRRGVYEKLLPLPREDQSDRPCFYSLCTLGEINRSCFETGRLREIYPL